MRIVMLLSNGFAPDPRVATEAKALVELGHQVTIFAWDRTCKLNTQEYYLERVQVVRCQVKTIYSRGATQIMPFLKFWSEATKFLQQNQPDVVHCHDLDTLRPGIDYGKKHGVPVIYDAHESYPDMVAHVFPKLILNQIKRMEEQLVPKATAVITVGKLLAAHFLELGAQKVVVVGNYKNLEPDSLVTEEATPPLKIIYVGGLNRDRLISPIIETVAGDLRYHLDIVGDGPERNKLIIKTGHADNIRFHGYLPQEQAKKIIAQDHLLYYGLDPNFPNNHYSAPNSLFLALASGRPVLTTSIGEIAEIVKAWNCGTVLPNLEIGTIQQVLANYFDRNLWQQQAMAAYQAAASEYNWQMASANLVSLYQSIGVG